MDDAFYDSLSQFEHLLQSLVVLVVVAGVGEFRLEEAVVVLLQIPEEAVHRVAGTRNGSQMQGSSASSASSPSKGISSTEKASESNQSASGNQESAEESGTQTDSLTSGNVEKNDKFSDNGKLPEDIPPADNDSVVEAQLRQAAIAEKDLKKKRSCGMSIEDIRVYRKIAFLL